MVIEIEDNKDRLRLGNSLHRKEKEKIHARPHANVGSYPVAIVSLSSISFISISLLIGSLSLHDLSWPTQSQMFHDYEKQKS